MRARQKRALHASQREKEDDTRTVSFSSSDNWTTLGCIIVYRLCSSDKTYRSEGTKRFLTHDVS